MTLIRIFLLSPGDDCHTITTNSRLQNFSPAIRFGRGVQQLLKRNMDGWTEGKHNFYFAIQEKKYPFMIIVLKGV